MPCCEVYFVTQDVQQHIHFICSNGIVQYACSALGTRQSLAHEVSVMLHAVMTCHAKISTRHIVCTAPEPLPHAPAGLGPLSGPAAPPRDGKSCWLSGGVAFLCWSKFLMPNDRPGNSSLASSASAASCSMHNIICCHIMKCGCNGVTQQIFVYAPMHEITACSCQIMHTKHMSMTSSSKYLSPA